MSRTSYTCPGAVIAPGFYYCEDFMPIQAIIFDIDGLMLDTEPISKRSWATVMGPAGFPLTDEVYQQMIGRTEADVRHMLADIYGAHFPFERMYHEREQRFNELVQAEGIPLKPGLLDCLEFVNREGLSKAVASSTYARLAEIKLSIAGIRQQFEIIVTGDQVKRGKPAPDLFLEAARRLDLPPSTCVVLEDSIAGICAAHAAGMRSLLVPDMQIPDEETYRLADGVLEHLGLVSGVIEGWNKV
jgi:HAD superfamily hydrolase (TIGR01509 family)